MGKLFLLETTQTSVTLYTRISINAGLLRTRLAGSVIHLRLKATPHTVSFLESMLLSPASGDVFGKVSGAPEEESRWLRVT